MSALRLAGGTVVTSLSPVEIATADVLVEDGRVTRVDVPGSGPTAPASETLDCSGCLVLPGLVCAHTHAYSALARGMPYRLAPPEDFVQVLRRVWWRLDRALDPAAIRASALVAGMGLPPLRGEVLAARPHARWGELHGLYTNERGRPPRIQLWMRTAKQKRVVAFRTYLRTLLHEVGHHVDYTGLRLADSFHTEGFYKRESSLFAQLVGERRPTMPSMAEYAKQPISARLDRCERTPDELAAAFRGQSEALLSRRPDAKNWAAKEVACHLRDTEEFFAHILRLFSTEDGAKVSIPDADKVAAERRYQQADAAEAVAEFRRRRAETLRLARALGAEQWKRSGVVGTNPMTLDALAALWAWHDDNHLDQAKRALEGKA